MSDKHDDNETTKPGAEQTLTLAEEQAEITKTKVVDRRVRLTRTTHAEEKVLETELSQEQVVVEHVLKNVPVEENNIPQVREEGDTLIIPVIEEQVEIIRRYVLKEEVHIRKVKTTEPYQETVILRRQEFDISTDEE